MISWQNKLSRWSLKCTKNQNCGFIQTYGKINVFYKLTLLSNNLVLISYLSDNYLKSWFSWLWLGVQETLKKRREEKTKTLKHEVKEKRRIQGKSNNNDKHPWFYLLYKKLYFAQKQSLRKNSLYHHILFTVFMRCRIFQTWKCYTNPWYT